MVIETMLLNLTCQLLFFPLPIIFIKIPSVMSDYSSEMSFIEVVSYKGKMNGEMNIHLRHWSRKLTNLN